MLTHIEQPFDVMKGKVASQFIVVFVISTADCSFGLLVLISTVRIIKNSLKNCRTAAAYGSCNIRPIMVLVIQSQSSSGKIFTSNMIPDLENDYSCPRDWRIFALLAPN